MKINVLDPQMAPARILSYCTPFCTDTLVGRVCSRFDGDLVVFLDGCCLLCGVCCCVCVCVCVWCVLCVVRWLLCVVYCLVLVACLLCVMWCVLFDVSCCCCVALCKK